MANYNSYTTSNWFEVKDIDSFKDELERVNGTEFFNISDNKVAVAIYGPLFSTIDEDGDEEFSEDDYYELIKRHIKDGEKVFVSSVGHEKLNYFGADCAIITNEKIEFKNFFKDIIEEFNEGVSIF